MWNKTRLVPRGYALRIPGAPSPADIAAAWARLPPAERFVAQKFTVRTGCGVATPWRHSGGERGYAWSPARRQWLECPTRIGARRNGAYPHAGIACRGAATAAAVAASAPEGSPAAAAPATAVEAAAPAPTALAREMPPKEPVSQQQAESTALLPAASPSGNGDNTDYSVGADNTVVVQAAETLGHFADWSKVS